MKTMVKRRPELLAPAGDAERLEAALFYGADAVYLGGKLFNMRAATESFDDEALKSAVNKCHEKGVDVHLVANTLPRNDEVEKLPAFFENAAEAGVDAFIIADIGVMRAAQKYAPGIDIHMSTQTGVVNYDTASALYDLGAKRIVMAREVSLKDIAEIRRRTPKELEIECFVHGAMCMSFSGRCMLSNYLTGRDANRGDCAQPCRWKYHLVEEKRPGQYFEITDSEDGTYILNSQDMCMIEHIGELVDAGVDSFKIEGRAKSAYYAAAVTNAYRAAIDEYLKNPSTDFRPSQWIIDEMKKISYRDYCTGFYFNNPSDNAHVYYDGIYIREWDIVANVLGSDGEYIDVIQRNRFFKGDELEVLMPQTEPFSIKVDFMTNESGEEIDVAPNPMAKIRIKCDREIPGGSILRKIRED
ncbi:MAG: U32 family peptidase [Clostridia bacterium]|nr:U32 family peptidase [Clostridia bacterium]MBR6512271.1 U32 family peptidase [Clostridia bacterium]